VTFHLTRSTHDSHTEPFKLLIFDIFLGLPDIVNPADQLGWRGCKCIGGLGYKILVEDRGPEAEANTGQRVSVRTAKY